MSKEERQAARKGVTNLEVRIPVTVPPMEGFSFDKKTGAFQSMSPNASINAKLFKMSVELASLHEKMDKLLKLMEH
jgi:hypothetical protein